MVTAGQPASAGAATSNQPSSSPVARSVTASGEFLVAADPAAQAIYVYRASDLVRTGQLTGLGLSSHGGTVQLPDGRLIFVDDTNGTIAAMRVDADGRPRIVNNVSIPGGAWPGAAWAVTDPQQRYFAVSGEDEGNTRSVTIIDLASFAAHQIKIPARPDATGRVPEMQVYLAGSPLQLLVTTGGAFISYPLAPILQGHTPEPTSSVPVGASTHGPVVSRDGRRVFSTTADGFNGATINARKLSRPRSVAYSSTRNVVQLYRPRLAPDDRHVWGSVAEDTGLAPAQWADTRNDVNLIDTVRFTSKLTRLPDGIAGRLAISSRYAAVTTTSPDGDVLTLLDA
ncbi:MAG: lactonase family protein, partial [Actinomycetota bacterium]|nr:lactonase family protein [Actinomycetota bacterium]